MNPRTALTTSALLAGCSFATLAPAPAWCEDIGEVLQRSQQVQAQAAERDAVPDSPAAQALRTNFALLSARATPIAAPDAAVLSLVHGGPVAETLMGRTIVMNVSAGDLPALCQQFLIAHELGHIEHMHWSQRIELYRRFIPGEVVQFQTDAVAPELRREAAVQSYEQEFEADAYAMRTLLAMGYSRDDLIAAFFQLGAYDATMTHPSSADRLGRLRRLDEGTPEASAAGAAGEIAAPAAPR